VLERTAARGVDGDIMNDRTRNRPGLGEIRDAVPVDGIVELATTKAEAFHARSGDELNE
jgi:hypothetical protein